MIEIRVEEFVRRLKDQLEGDAMAAFFLGAGASISSGVPGAATLVNGWVHELHDLETGDATSFEDWRAKHCPEFDPSQPARSYATIMRRRFPTGAQRQQEIERIVRGRDPGFAYATLAQLLAHAGVGPRCNIVVTTNFDDLVADALYLFTSMRPLVVTHEALVGYAAVGRTRPTVIKLHGDAMLEPRNTEDEVAELAPEFVQALQSHLRSRGLVIIGYGGNDKGVFNALSSLPPNTITHGIYWVNDTLPDNDFGRWLRSLTESFWVKHLNFDELMAVVKDEFDLQNPDGQRFDELLQRYRDTFADLQQRVQAQKNPNSAVARSVEEVRKRFGNWFSVELEAQKYKTDPAKAEKTYEAGLREFPDSVPLMGNYANFLTDVRGDHDRAQELYERALAADPGHANNLGNYANFLTSTRGDHDRAQELYERALAADPGHANNLGNYAGLLYALGDFERGRELAQAARATNSFASPTHAALRLEVDFYELANDNGLSADDRDERLSRIKAAIIAGGRSPAWNFDANLKRARAMGSSNSELELLAQLARVITCEALADTLDPFPEWKSA